MSDALNHLIDGDLEKFKQAINQSLYSKIGDAFSARKQELAQELFSEEEECSECGENVQEENAVPGPVVARRIAGGMPENKAKRKPLGHRGKRVGHG
jgi:hypothetical protein